jgi:hypothetical protein
MPAGRYQVLSAIRGDRGAGGGDRRAEQAAAVAGADAAQFCRVGCAAQLSEVLALFGEQLFEAAGHGQGQAAQGVRADNFVHVMRPADIR